MCFFPGASAETARRKCQPLVAGLLPMPVLVASRRRTRLSRDFPDALIIDVTSRSAEPWVRLSPFYPHGGIPVPGHLGRTSQSVEGIWQALKVFATEPEDFTKLD